jgi:hypothetical protein
MSILLITYDLNRPGQTYDQLLTFIKQHAWAKLSESSYAIQTSEAPQAIFTQISNLIDPNDNLYIVTLSSPYWGRGPQSVNDWLRQRL